MNKLEKKFRDRWIRLNSKSAYYYGKAREAQRNIARKFENPRRRKLIGSCYRAQTNDGERLFMVIGLNEEDSYFKIEDLIQNPEGMEICRTGKVYPGFEHTGSYTKIPLEEYLDFKQKLLEILTS